MACRQCRSRNLAASPSLCSQVQHRSAEIRRVAASLALAFGNGWLAMLHLTNHSTHG